MYVRPSRRFGSLLNALKVRGMLNERLGRVQAHARALHIAPTCTCTCLRHTQGMEETRQCIVSALNACPMECACIVGASGAACSGRLHEIVCLLKELDVDGWVACGLHL